MEQEKIQMMYTEAQHEREMTRLEVQCKRWFIAFLVVLGMLFATNAAWTIYENQYQYVVVTQDAFVDGDGANYINGTGDMTYGSQSTPDNSDTGEEGVE